MANVSFKGKAVQIIGIFPTIGQIIPEFQLVKSDLSELRKEDLKGKKIIFNIFPSLDTGVCAASVRKFHELSNSLPNTTIVCVSKDLPFAHNRFCTAEGLNNVVTASGFRSTFGKDFGVEIADGPLAGLYSRAVICTDESGKIIYTEQVKEITQEPNYDKVLANF